MAALFGQVIRFGLVGTIGFVVDAAVLTLLMAPLFGMGPYGARVISFLAAATVTWALNRRFTFRDRSATGHGSQWARFVAANSVGAVVNYGTFAALVHGGGVFAEQPVLAVAAGSLAGMAFNFTASKLLVFRETADAAPRTAD